MQCIVQDWIKNKNHIKKKSIEKIKEVGLWTVLLPQYSIS